MSNENITLLLISNSKLLKNKFIESLNNDLNHFSLMNKSVDGINSVSERINLSCLVCDYCINPNNSDDTNYVQLIDANDKNIINTLVHKTVHSVNDKKFQFNINGFVYLYDETNSDTFTYLQSIHNELRKSFKDFIISDNSSFLLCNMINAANISGMPVSTSEDSLKIINLVENFLDDYKNVQYVSQPYEETIMGSKPIYEEENQDKLKVNFDSLIGRFLPSVKNKNEDNYFSIRSETNSLNSADENYVRHISNKILPKKNYEGEMLNNLRNGFGIYVYDNRFFRYEGEWRNGVKHGSGKLAMRDGSYYEGDFKKGEICGKGYKFDKNKQTEYTGDFFYGEYHGKGVLRCKNQFTYDGDFFENMMHGYGELNELKQNHVYQGQFYRNLRHGQGLQKYNDNSTYTGDWIRGKRQGQGELVFSDGSIYDVIKF